MSLDAFRGLAVLTMLLVNDKVLGPVTPEHLRHAEWADSPHFADMVFPWFLLISGVAIAFSAASHFRRGLPWWTYETKVVKRAALLFGLGLLISSSWADQPLFGMGVLQLIGLSYLVAGLLYRLPLKPRAAMVAIFLVGYWAAIRFLPVPGVGAGVFTADHNWVAYVNRAYLSRLGMEGLLSVFPGSALALIGTGIGDLLRGGRAASSRKAMLLVAGGACLTLAGWLWNLDLEFNKPVWTPSFVLLAAGLGAVVLGVFYALIDIKGWRRWAFPLAVAGMNAIFAYTAPILFKSHILHEWHMPSVAGSPTVEQVLQGALFSRLGVAVGGVV